MKLILTPYMIVFAWVVTTYKSGSLYPRPVLVKLSRTVNVNTILATKIELPQVS